MQVTRCFSSAAMTELLSWRNSQGREENWINGRQSFEGYHVLRRITTEIGLGILTITAVIETVAYAALSLVTLPFDENPSRFFQGLLESSTFTVLWAAADAVIYNPFFVNVMTHESFARYWAQNVCPVPMRLDDIIYIYNWSQRQNPQAIQDAFLRPIALSGQATGVHIDEGAKFLAEEVVTDEMKTLFKEVDVSIVPYIMTKAVYIYAAGSKKDVKAIPEFFKPETRMLIYEFRKDHPSVDDPMPQTPEDLESQQSEAFIALRAIGSKESQGGLLVTGCWEKACELL